ncbi:transcriptional regulator [Dactylosporangium vinaceum]|uniref:Helix-turn-helix domain-containing protein n=1 Tax=Dactylosporangium vinaceum TaxID=53362 RepID=A0ABV5MH57_9ACTN|nr:helix-turn-helix transcriptional regulator [Dactylosporangium vinaceum]UAB94896.1 transcriptional regulator [Dactylosporangium vinaceum]
MLYNLRDNAGETQQDVADALNELGAVHGRRLAITANQLSRWERGVVFPSAFYRKLLAEHFGVSVAELGLTRPKVTAAPARTEESDAFAIRTDTEGPEMPRRVAESQQQWRTTRRALNAHRVALAREAARLYDAELRVGTSGLIAPPSWLPSTPRELSTFGIAYDNAAGEPDVTGSEEASAATRPLASEERRYARYSQAIRDVDHPRLFENRLAWRLTDVDWDQADALAFATSTYFGMVDTAEALAHEMAAQHLTGAAGGISPASWRGLTFRRHLGDPFDLYRRALVSSTDTLTIRADADGATFVLHNRSAGNVAVAGGMLHIMPAGVFQPSSILPAAQTADFDLWRNIMREFSEEFLGNAEHGGDGNPADYAVEPLASFEAARAAGRIRVFCLGVALDALTLYGELLTVAVFDGETYDRLFADMVDHNDEGTIVKTGRVQPTSALPFTRHVLDELAHGGRLAPAAAGCLELAWQHRHTILRRN